MNTLIIYFKQAWNLIKQEKLFSSIYILGTGLSITIVMVVFIVYYIRIANIYPETNRDRMLSVKTVFRICGVVKDASFVTARTFAQLWLPYTTSPYYESSHAENSLGIMEAYILAPSAGKMGKVKQEILANIDRYNNTLTNNELNLNGQPDRQWQSLFRTGSNATPNFNKILWQYGLFFLVLLLVPTVGLSGMADSRMERRIAESGVRRAFGAPVRSLIRQIMTTVITAVIWLPARKAAAMQPADALHYE